jgi:putative transposase
MKHVVVYVMACHGYSERRACGLTRQARSTQRKPSRRNPHTAIRLRMHEIAQTRIRHGYRRVHIMLKRNGWSVGANTFGPPNPSSSDSPTLPEKLDHQSGQVNRQ